MRHSFRLSLWRRLCSSLQCRSLQSRRTLAALVALTLLLTAQAVAARPGGGHSFSGGSGSGHGGGGGDMGDLVQIVLWLCLEHPAVGLPLLAIGLVVWGIKAAKERRQSGWSTAAPAGEATTGRAMPRSLLCQIRELDPDFSLVLFEDFVYLLYAALHRARAAGTESLAAYLSPELGQALMQRELADVRGIVIGAMRLVDFSGVQGQAVEVELEFEANYVEVPRAGGERRFYAVDRMRLRRSRDAKSRPFARARTLDCPHCGAPIQAMRGTRCSYCQQEVGWGRFDWMVSTFHDRSRSLRGPLLTQAEPERGTELPTLTAPGAAQRMDQLVARDPALSWDGLLARVNWIFQALQAGWSGREPLRIRPYVSDNLFQSMLYWIDLYVQQRCRNVTDNARVVRIDLADVLSDRYYDAVTLRVFASGPDYTISDEGRLLSGSRTRLRFYSEYWTLIRGAERRGPPRADPACPNCGAPLQIGMTGNCEYCRVKVTTGEFDWVLSRIEQDEAYTG